jgi:CRP-like cAMP-binding protein
MTSIWLSMYSICFVFFFSETGRVLTTMKAGDFFGEIGILNLDGLNK